MAEEKSESKSSAGASSPSSPCVKAGSPRSPRPPRRVKLSAQQLDELSKDEIVAKWRETDSYVESLEARSAAQEDEIISLRKSEEKYRQQYTESSHREKLLARRISSKEQELQEYLNQITEMKAAHAPSAMALRSALLDPAVNILIQKLRQELITTKAKLEDTQNELSAWKFTPDSNTGKRLMAKCRLLYQENEDLGRMIASGRIAKLEGELALQKSFSEEVKKSQSELDEFIQDLDEDVEGMQSTIYFLQQELRKAHESVILLQQENSSLKNSTNSETNLTNGLSPHTPPIEMKKEVEDEEEENKSVRKATEVPEEPEVSQTGARTPPMPASPVRNDDEHQPERNDESSSDSAALIIKVENEELSEREDEDEEKGNDGEKSTDGEGNANERTLRTKNSRQANGEEVTNRMTRGRERTKREKSAGSDDERGLKKKRRESVMSLEYNEPDDDALVLTNGETLQSDQE